MHAAVEIGAEDYIVGGINGGATNGIVRGAGAPTMRDGRRQGLRMSVALGNGADTAERPPEARLDLASPLELIAQDLVAANPDARRKDIVFVLDVSQSMQDNIYAVARHLSKMTDLLEANGADFRIGIATFHEPPWYAVSRRTVRVMRRTDDVKRVRRELRRVECSGGEKAINAIMAAVEQVKFRSDTERSFVIVTDEYADGDFEARQVFGALYRSGVRVDVIGVDEPFQRALAARSGGVWIPISSLGS